MEWSRLERARWVDKGEKEREVRWSDEGREVVEDVCGQREGQRGFQRVLSLLVPSSPCPSTSE